MFCLSFTEDFFFGTTDPYEVEPSDRPTSCLQAIISLPEETKLEIARDVLGSSCPEIYITTEAFPFDVLERIRKTDLCEDLGSPVTVYIDDNQDHTITVYDD